MHVMSLQQETLNPRDSRHLPELEASSTLHQDWGVERITGTCLVRRADVAAGGVELRDVGAPAQRRVQVAPRFLIKLRRGPESTLWRLGFRALGAC